MVDNRTLFSHLINNLFPSWSASKQCKDLSTEERAKYDRIRKMIDEVGRKVGISHPESVKFYITKDFGQNACMSGSVAAIGSPVMALANDYFTHFDSPDVQKDPEYGDWEELVDSLPTHPLELAKCLRECTPDVQKKIQCLHSRFAPVLTEEELQGIIAHELGHAKHLHSWKTLFFMVPLSLIAFKIQKATKPYFRGLLSSMFAILLFDFGLKQVSIMHEKEADEETSVCQTYNKGLQKHFKKQLISELLKNPSDHAVKEMLNEIDYSTHPHCAKRVFASLAREEKAAKSTALYEKVIACFGGILLIYAIYLNKIEEKAQ